MNNNIEKFFKFLTLKTSPHEHSWLFHLFNSMQELLTELIKPQTVQSLERLQVVTMSCENISRVECSRAHFTNIAAEISGEANKFFAISGDLMGEEKRFLSAKIVYFVRGQRKFFQTQERPFTADLTMDFGLLTPGDIDSFYQIFGHKNDYFSNENIALLNGLASPTVPMEIAIFLVTVCALIEAQKAHLTLTSLSLDFLDTIRLDENLRLSVGVLDKTLQVTLFAADTPKVQGTFEGK